MRQVETVHHCPSYPINQPISIQTLLTLFFSSTVLAWESKRWAWLGNINYNIVPNLARSLPSQSGLPFGLFWNCLPEKNNVWPFWPFLGLFWKWKKIVFLRPALEKSEQKWQYWNCVWSNLAFLFFFGPGNPLLSPLLINKAEKEKSAFILFSFAANKCIRTLE